MQSKLWMYSTLMLSSSVFAGSFIDNSTVDLTTRNFYFDRDYQEVSKYPAAKDWSQGLIFRANSGYTEGTVGFGLDILATAGFKLDASADYAGTGNLPRDPVTNEPADSYGQIGVTGKSKISKTELKVGTLRPMNPVLVASPARLLPQTYRGISLESKDIPNLDFQSAYIDQVNQRDSTNWENMRISGVNGRFKSADTDQLYYLGGNYQLIPSTKLTSFYMDVEDLYNQSMFGITYNHKFNDSNNFSSQLRYYRSREDGQAKAGLVDNNSVHSYFELKHQNHKFILATSHHSGDTAFPYLTGGETGLFIDTWPAEFLNPKEHVYSFRYEYDFKNYVPGLRFMTRYTTGDNIYAPNLGGTDLKEHETDFDIGYIVQNGPLKNLSLRARYAMYDNNMLPTAQIKPSNETRFNIDYTWKFK